MEAINIGNLEIKIPIIQGGMGVGISLSRLASAVANEGGVGTISAVGIGMLEPGYQNHFRASNKIALRKEIRKARKKTKGVLAVNIMLAVSDFDDLLKIALEEEIDIVFISAGLPLHKPRDISEEILYHSKTKFVPKVSSAKAARLIFEYWFNKYKRVPDALVIEGPESGGHQGFKMHELKNKSVHLGELIQQSKKIIDHYEQKTGNNIPIIAAGGIYTGYDIFEAIRRGASAVKMGSRFVTSFECDASPVFKNNFLNRKKEDMVLIKSPVGLPARVIRNSFVDEIIAGKAKPVNCPWKCLKTCNYKNVQFCIAEALFNSAQGKLKHGFSFASTKIHQATKICSIPEIFNKLIHEYNQAVEYSSVHLV